MNDTDNSVATQGSPPSDPPQKTREETRALFETAWRAMWDAAAELDSASFLQGYRQGWKDSRDTFMKYLTEQIASKQDHAQEAPPAPTAALVAPALTGIGRRFVIDLNTSPIDLGAPAADWVYWVIEQNPGLRGVEIAQILGDPPLKIKERTIRTALHRLKRAEDGKRIRVEDGRWYAADAEPQSQQLPLETD